MHNMIVEDERGTEFENMGSYEQFDSSPRPVQVSRNLNNHDYTNFARRFSEVRDTTIHHQLREDLIEHLYMKKEEEERRRQNI